MINKTKKWIIIINNENIRNVISSNSNTFAHRGNGISSHALYDYFINLIKLLTIWIFCHTAMIFFTHVWSRCTFCTNIVWELLAKWINCLSS